MFSSVSAQWYKQLMQSPKAPSKKKTPNFNQLGYFYRCNSIN